MAGGESLRFVRVLEGDARWFGVARPDGNVLRFDRAPFDDYVALARQARSAGVSVTAFVEPWIDLAIPFEASFNDLDRAPGDAPHLVTPFDPPETWGAAFTYDTRAPEPLPEDDFLRERRSKRVVVFFKTTPFRTVGPNDALGSRSDTTMMIPEPELGVVLDGDGEILGYTVVNDISSRDLPREDPLYVAYSKTFTRCVSFGPCIVPPEAAPDDDHWTVRCRVEQNGAVTWDETNTTRRRYRSWGELRSALLDHNIVLPGTLYATGTVLTPPQTMHVREGDRLEVSIEGIGRLVNTVVDV